LPRCGPHVGGAGGDEHRGRPGPDAVVDVDHHEACTARLEHGEQGSSALAAGAVADADRQTDDGNVDQARDQAREDAIHPGGHDDDVGRPGEHRGQGPKKAVQARNPQIRLHPGLEAARLDQHPGFVGGREVRGARGQQAHPPRSGFGFEASPEQSRAGVIAKECQPSLAGAPFQLRPVLGAEPADQPLSLLIREADRQPGCVLWRLAAGQHDLGKAPAPRAAEIQSGPAVQFLELDSAQLGLGLIEAQLARQQPSQD
jgi:hypothetical protein